MLSKSVRIAFASMLVAAGVAATAGAQTSKPAAPTIGAKPSYSTPTIKPQPKYAPPTLKVTGSCVQQRKEDETCKGTNQTKKWISAIPGAKACTGTCNLSRTRLSETVEVGKDGECELSGWSYKASCE